MLNLSNVMLNLSNMSTERGNDRLFTVHLQESLPMFPVDNLKAEQRLISEKIR